MHCHDWLRYRLGKVSGPDLNHEGPELSKLQATHAYFAMTRAVRNCSR